MQQMTFAPSGFGTNDVQIMAGTFDDFTFDDVIQVLGLSRQCLRLMVRRGEAAISEVLLKAGQVLDARMPSTSDPEKVFHALYGSAVRGSGLSFTVYHTEPTGPFPVPRGRLSEVYAQVRAAGQGAVQRAASLLRPADHAPEPTVRIARTGTQPGATAPAGFPGRTDVGRGGAFNTAAADPALSSATLSKAVLADLRPVLREEMASVLGQVREQSTALHTMDGRLLALPQLVAAEIRLAMAQHERNARPPEQPSHRPLLVALSTGVAVLFVAVVLLALKVLG